MEPTEPSIETVKTEPGAVTVSKGNDLIMTKAAERT